MSKRKIPSVLHDPDFPDEAHLNLEDGDTLAVGSSAWYSWLEEHSSFRFDSGDNLFTAVKRTYETGDYWYANRKIEGKTANKYLGKSEALTVNRMKEIAVKLSQPVQPSSVVKIDVQPKRVDVQLNSETLVVQEIVQPGVQELEKKLGMCKRQLSDAQSQVVDLGAQLEEQKRIAQALRREQKQLEQELEEANQEIDRLQLQYQQFKSIKDSQSKQLEEITQLRQALKEAGAMADQFHAEVGSLKDKRDTLCSQLQDQSAKAGKWYEAAKEAQKLAEDRLQEIERLRNESQNRPAADPDAIALLQGAITPKSKGGSYAANNATGLRSNVEKALKLLGA